MSYVVIPSFYPLQMHFQTALSSPPRIPWPCCPSFSCQASACPASSSRPCTAPSWVRWAALPDWRKTRRAGGRYAARFWRAVMTDLVCEWGFLTNDMFVSYVPFQRFPTDKAYFIAKEILTTERTYLKDLEVITVVSWCNFWMHPIEGDVCKNLCRETCGDFTARYLHVCLYVCIM